MTVLRWNLTGTLTQIGIAKTALLDRCKFDWALLTKLPGTPELGWRDLNPGMPALSARAVASAHPVTEAPEDHRGHEGHHGPPTEDKPDALIAELEDGRRWTQGLIYTVSGRIYIDQRLVVQPETAMAVILAEGAHAVDFFLPMTDAQRNEFLRLWGVGGTWWEVVDYGEEYFRLGGEAFMDEFVRAYGVNLDLGASGAFLHDKGVEPEDVYRVLGIRRTDYVPPAQFVRYGTSKVYHKPTHYPSKAGAITVTATTGLRPCKVCKPVAA